MVKVGGLNSCLCFCSENYSAKFIYKHNSEERHFEGDKNVEDLPVLISMDIMFSEAADHQSFPALSSVHEPCH